MSEAVDINPQPGSDDTVVALMKRFKLPMTREVYLDLAYFGETPEQIDAEVMANMPEEFKDG